MGDLISRQAAIDALRLIPCDLGKRELEDAIKAIEQLPSARTEPLTIRVNNELTKEEYEKLMHDIKDAPIVLLPSAQPERKKGEWNTYYHSDIDFSHSCNQCGYSAPYQMIGGEVFQKKWNFCPNCGADMRGKQDG